MARSCGGRPARARRGDKTFIIRGDFVLEGDGSKIVAREAQTVKTLWTAPGGSGSMRRHRFFVTGGRAWHTASGSIAGYDLTTGKRTKTIDSSSVQSRGQHLRCCRGKATERSIITQFRGADFVSLTDDNHRQNGWVRGPGRYGLMPWGGMVYVPPYQCFAMAAQ